MNISGRALALISTAKGNGVAALENGVPWRPGRILALPPFKKFSIENRCLFYLWRGRRSVALRRWRLFGRWCAVMRGNICHGCSFSVWTLLPFLYTVRGTDASRISA